MWGRGRVGLFFLSASLCFFLLLLSLLKDFCKLRILVLSGFASGHFVGCLPIKLFGNLEDKQPVPQLLVCFTHVFQRCIQICQWSFCCNRCCVLGQPQNGILQRDDCRLNSFQLLKKYFPLELLKCCLISVVCVRPTFYMTEGHNRRLC